MTPDSTIVRAMIAALDDETLSELADRLRSRLALGMRETEPLVYTVATLARELEVSQRTVRGAIGRGELQAVRRGRHYLIAADAVAEWAAPPVNSPARSRDGGTSRGPQRPGVMVAAVARLDGPGYTDSTTTKRPGGARTPRARQQEGKS